MGNFLFLKSHWDDLSRTGELAESYVYSDPNMSGEAAPDMEIEDEMEIALEENTAGGLL